MILKNILKTTSFIFVNNTAYYDSREVITETSIFGIVIKRKQYVHKYNYPQLTDVFKETQIKSKSKVGFNNTTNENKKD